MVVYSSWVNIIDYVHIMNITIKSKSKIMRGQRMNSQNLVNFTIMFFDTWFVIDIISWTEFMHSLSIYLYVKAVIKYEADL